MKHRFPQSGNPTARKLLTKTGIPIHYWFNGTEWRIRANVRGRRICKTTAYPEEAERIARSIASDLESGFDPETILTTRQRCDYLDAVKRLGKTPLHEAVDFYLKHHHMEHGITLPEIRDALIPSLEKARRSAQRIREVKAEMKNLIQRFGDTPVHGITTAELEDYLERWTEPYTRMTKIRFIRLAWNYAKKRGHLLANMSAADNLVQIPVKPKDPTLCPPETLRKYLAAARSGYAEIIPFLTIAAFAGVRTAEIGRLRWKDIDFDNRLVLLPSEVTKTSKRRTVPMTDNLFEWLDAYKKYLNPREDDKLVKLQTHNMVRDIRTAFPEVGVIPPNSLRHTAATMFIASGQSSIQVSSWLGNSVDVLESHYKGMATPKDAGEWFNIYPSNV